MFIYLIILILLKIITQINDELDIDVGLIRFSDVEYKENYICESNSYLKLLGELLLPVNY